MKKIIHKNLTVLILDIIKTIEGTPIYYFASETKGQEEKTKWMFGATDNDFDLHGLSDRGYLDFHFTNLVHRKLRISTAMDEEGRRTIIINSNKVCISNSLLLKMESNSPDIWSLDNIFSPFNN